MGQDKALMPFGGYRSLCEYQYRRLSPLFERVYISTKEPKFSFDAPLLYDTHTQSSPLVGVVSIFETLEEPEVFILSVDAPFVGQEIIQALYTQSQESSFDAIIAQSPRGVEPLCGIYNRSILGKAKKLLSEDRHRLSTLLSLVDSKFVKFEESWAFDNLNYIEEYREAIQSKKI